MRTKFSRFRLFLSANVHAYDYLVGGYVVLALFLSRVIGFKLDFSVVYQQGYDTTFLSIVLLYFLIHSTVLALSVRRSGEDSFIFGKAWRGKVSELYFRWRTLIEIVRVLVLLKITLMIYCNIKQAIPFINPGIHDSTLQQIDRYLHFGVNPNIAAVTLFGAPVVAFLFDKLYVLWYLLKPLVLAYFAMTPDRKAHVSFYTAYFAMWIFGGLLSVALPSLGPVYTHPEWFTNLNAAIAGKLQTQLMTHYEAALAHPEKYKVFIYEGVAAFPSLHVGIAAIFAFFVFQVNRGIGAFFIAYAVIVQIGSVLLGWHYAIDGYFAIGMAYLFFRIANGCNPLVFMIPDRRRRKTLIKR